MKQTDQMFRIAIEPPERGSAVRSSLKMVAGSRRDLGSYVVVQFVDTENGGEILERHYEPRIPVKWEQWFYLSPKHIVSKPGHQLKRRYIMAAKKKAQKPKRKPAGVAKVRRIVPSPTNGTTGYPISALVRWMGAQGWTPHEAMYVLGELKAEPKVNAVRTFITAGRKGERGDPAEVTKADANALLKMAHKAPEQIRAARAGRYSLFGFPVTAVLRTMGAKGLNVADAKLALASFKVKPSDASISIFVNAGRTGKRGAPAELSKTDLAKVLKFKGKGKPAPKSTPKAKPKAKAKAKPKAKISARKKQTLKGKGLSAAAKRTAKRKPKPKAKPRKRASVKELAASLS